MFSGELENKYKITLSADNENDKPKINVIYPFGKSIDIYFDINDSTSNIYEIVKKRVEEYSIMLLRYNKFKKINETIKSKNSG